jgi:hypothetical protein
VRKLIVLLLLAALGAFAASDAVAGVVRIEASAGGRIGDYLALFLRVREAGHTVMIDGPCFSACTLVLSVIPRNRICVTPRAVLGFHAAWMPDQNGRPRRHTTGTQLLMDIYPRPVQHWIKRHGGLTSRTLLLRGRALRAMYRRCG